MENQPINEVRLKIAGALPAIAPDVLEKGKSYLVTIPVSIVESRLKDNFDGTDDKIMIAKVDPAVEIQIINL